MKDFNLHEAFACARDALYAPARVSAQDALYDAHPAPNYRAFCIAVLELRINATPELLTALARRYGLMVEDESGRLVENPAL